MSEISVHHVIPKHKHLNENKVKIQRFTPKYLELNREILAGAVKQIFSHWSLISAFYFITIESFQRLSDASHTFIPITHNDYHAKSYLTKDIKTVNFDTLMQFLSEYFDWDDPAFIQLTNVKWQTKNLDVNNAP